MIVTIDNITFETDCFKNIEFPEFEKQFKGKFYSISLKDAFDILQKHTGDKCSGDVILNKIENIETEKGKGKGKGKYGFTRNNRNKEET